MNERGWIAGANCPECGSELAPGAPACGTCGFELVEAPRRESRRGRARLLVVALGLLLVAAGIVMLAARERDPEPPPPVAAPVAERLLESRLSSLGDDDTAAVTCPAAVMSGSVTRCRVRYSGGGVQPILVRLSASGELDVDIP